MRRDLQFTIVLNSCTVVNNAIGIAAEQVCVGTSQRVVSRRHAQALE